ncbi:DNA repair protein RecO [Staphylococcus ratti]|uniref:DNA repair protein RecO n=1 Tax=Staphylococcus ratti TaxID=2892440 RepID=A0ABY3PFN6_9STAP|nr:DNA repair protein RecO [Staphylococcus ratti]UEX91089.1 DNA repair protein RecO [Staphylococcus ratti]
MLLKQNGIIIKAVDYGESDRIITVLNEYGAKIPIMVRRAKKIKSGYQATTQPFVKALFIYNKFRGMGTLNSVDVINLNYDIRMDIFTNSYASLCLEVIERSIENEEVEKGMYQLLNFALDRINEGVSPQLIANIVMLKCLPRYGITLELERCVISHSSDAKTFSAYSFKYNGVISKQMQHHDEHAVPLSNKTLYITNLLQHLTLTQINTLRIHQDIIDEMSMFILMLYKEYVGMFFKSQRLINQLKRTEIDLASNDKNE